MPRPFSGQGCSAVFSRSKACLLPSSVTSCMCTYPVGACQTAVLLHSASVNQYTLDRLSASQPRVSFGAANGRQTRSVCNCREQPRQCTYISQCTCRRLLTYTQSYRWWYLSTEILCKMTSCRQLFYVDGCVACRVFVCVQKSGLVCVKTTRQRFISCWLTFIASPAVPTLLRSVTRMCPRLT